MGYWIEDFENALREFVLPEGISIAVTKERFNFTFKLRLENKDMGGFTFNSFDNVQDVMESCKTYVLYEYQGKGYAQLMQEIKRYICKRLPLSLVANVSIYNETQIHILKKFGWMEVPLSHRTHMWYLDHRSYT